MREYFPKPKSLGANIKFQVDFYKYVTKADLKMQQVLIYHVLLKRLIQPMMKSDVDINQILINLKVYKAV